MKMTLIALMCLALAGGAYADLTYSGHDLTSGTNNTTPMTITCTAGDGGTGATLWELDLARLTFNQTIMFTALRIDGANHAGGSGVADWGWGLWAVEGNDGTFSELNKTAANYSFQLVQTQGNFTTTTVFTINPSTGSGTHWTANHTVQNTGGAADTPFGTQDWYLGLQQQPIGGGGYTLNGTSGGADRFMVLAANPDGAWQVNENVDRNATGIVATDNLWGRATVLDNAAAATMGLKAGLWIEAGSDTIAYYPSDAIGNAEVGPNYGRVFIEGTPREFMGTVRANHVALEPGATYVTEMYLDMNIVPEPAGVGLFLSSIALLRLRRRRA